jgi:hypothetical protein
MMIWTHSVYLYSAETGATPPRPCRQSYASVLLHLLHTLAELTVFRTAWPTCAVPAQS